MLEPDENSEQEQKPDESPEQEVLEPDEEQEQKPDESPEQDLLQPQNSGDFIELELCEDAEDITTAKEQEDEALPTRRRKGK